MIAKTSFNPEDVSFYLDGDPISLPVLTGLAMWQSVGYLTFDPEWYLDEETPGGACFTGAYDEGTVIVSFGLRIVVQYFKS